MLCFLLLRKYCSSYISKNAVIIPGLSNINLNLNSFPFMNSIITIPLLKSNDNFLINLARKETNPTDFILGPYMIVTVRLIRNFEYRTIRTIPIREVDTQQTVKQFIARLLQEVKSVKGIPPPFKTHPYDTLKISHQAGSFKANDIVINLEGDETLILPGEKTLADCGVVSETEMSFFNLVEYQKYKLNPEKKW